jgi:hypothetical protein
MNDDNRPFRIQSTLERPACTIPWWLADIAYEEYVRLYGTSQSLERINERGGFGRDELVNLIRTK